MRRLILYLILCTMGMSNSFAQGFYISGTSLKDASGNNFVMKGFSVPLAWFVNDVNNNIANIKKNTGANCLRIVVTTSTPDAAWQTCVNNCIANKIVPMVELHDVTGSPDANALNNMAKFWASKAWFLTQTNVARYVLINIANEWGDWNIGNSLQYQWRDAYKTVINTIRNAGIKTTLVVDAPAWGQDLRNANTLVSYAKDVQNNDPKHNILFSIHMYCEWAYNSTSSLWWSIPNLKSLGIPIIVGEFGYQHDAGNGTACDIPEQDIISTCQSNGTGWLAWSWKGNGSPVQYLDLSYDWAGTSLSSWGNTVVWGSNGTKTASQCASFTKSASVAPKEVTASKSENVYPNPVSDGHLNIELKGYTGEINIKIVDINGKTVKEQDFNDASVIGLDLNIAAGIYVLRIFNNNETYLKKLVVK